MHTFVLVHAIQKYDTFLHILKMEYLFIPKFIHTQNESWCNAVVKRRDYEIGSPGFKSNLYLKSLDGLPQNKEP